ncbi:MAG TPA: flagellar hook protein FlgE [Candidatus Binatia bacterium]|nr:flagellar hook protein FlgE [Candidatus Binatia bacterium]
MAILGSLSIARSGLVATGEALGVTSNNIANVNTTAFKGGRSEFADLVAAHGSRGSEGIGTRLADVSTSFAQGGIESTGRATDLAIQGDGFFVVRNGEDFLYTRAGNFHLDASQTLVTGRGDAVQGFELDASGQPIGAPVDIDFGGATSQPQPTANVQLASNLDASAPLIDGGFDGTTFDTAYATSNFSVPARVYDSLGVGHTVTFFFTRTDANAWDVNVAVDAGEAGGTAGEIQSIGTASLTFNPDGSLAGPDPTDLTVTFNGADEQTITVDFGTPNTDATPGAGLDGLTQFGSPSNASATADGFAAGQLATIAVDGDGVVTGVFDNGQTRQLYRVALADFPSTQGLVQLGDGLFQATSESGSAAISTAGAGGPGRIVGESIERSNVDLAQEFVDLISLQRSFQANARVITTGDAVLNELINIVR